MGGVRGLEVGWVFERKSVNVTVKEWLAVASGSEVFSLILIDLGWFGIMVVSPRTGNCWVAYLVVPAGGAVESSLRLNLTIGEDLTSRRNTKPGGKERDICDRSLSSHGAFSLLV